MEYKISNLDFTMKSEDDFYDTVDMGAFRDADADLIYEHLHKKMRIIPFCDYLKRYIDGEKYEDCLKPTNPEYIMSIKIVR